MKGPLKGALQSFRHCGSLCSDFGGIQREAHDDTPW